MYMYVHVHERDQVLCVGAQKSSQLVHEIAMADRYEYMKKMSFVLCVAQGLNASSISRALAAEGLLYSSKSVALASKG